MKDVAILTKYYKNYNYGGMLQGYALHRIINEMGYTCDIISYDVSCNKNPVYSSLFEQCRQYGVLSAFEKISEKAIGKCKIFIKDILHARKKLFDDFEAEAGTDTRYYDDTCLDELNNEYKVFVSGSDQIWNPNAVRFLFLQGFVKGKERKISYAASIGRDSFSDMEAERMLPFIKDFMHIGVREETAKKILEKYLNNPVTVVLDPTMLIPREVWTEVATDRLINERYALYYAFSDCLAVRKRTAAFCRKHGLKMVMIPYANQEFNINDNIGDCIRLKNIGPREFLSAIKNADYVFTDSFHGAVFSIIFNIQFAVFERNKSEHVSMNSRLYDLLNTFGLKERIIRFTENMKIHLNAIEYNEVNTILKEKQASSINFLLDSLRSGIGSMEDI